MHLRRLREQSAQQQTAAETDHDRKQRQDRGVSPFPAQIHAQDVLSFGIAVDR